MIRNILLLLILTIAVPAFAQNNNYINEGDKLFAEGRYDDAAKEYMKYYVLTGDTVKVNPKTRLCTRCKEALGAALRAAAHNEYEKAIEYYTRLSELNPNDPNYLEGIETARQMIQSVKSYKIGDVLHGYRICYVDDSGQHGLILMAASDQPVYYHTQLAGELPEGAHVPSLYELQLIWPNARTVGLYCDHYWTSSTVDYVDKNDKTKTGRYIFDINSGDKRVGKYADLSNYIWIGSF